MSIKRSRGPVGIKRRGKLEGIRPSGKTVHILDHASARGFAFPFTGDSAVEELSAALFAQRDDS